MTIELNKPAISEESYSVWGGRINVRVKVAGAGKPLIYFHPASGLVWDPFLSALADEYTVYAPEFPGTSAGDPYAIRALADVSDAVLIYDELIRQIGAVNPVLIGQSFGGMLAAELAAHFPHLTDKLVLMDSVGLWRDDLPFSHWMAVAPDDLPALLFDDPSGANAQAFLTPPDDPKIALSAAVAMVWSLGCTGKLTWPIPDRGLRKRLHRITASTLIVWGENDRLIPAGYAAEFESLIDKSRVAIIPGSGHVPQVEQLSQTLGVVREFLHGNTNRDVCTVERIL